MKTWIRGTLLAAGAVAALTTGTGLATASVNDCGATISNSPTPNYVVAEEHDSPAPPAGGQLPRGGLGLPQGFSCGR